MELLEFLIITVTILYIIRMVVRIVMPMLFQKVMNKAQQQQNAQQNYTSTKAGGVKVDYIPQSPKGKIPDSEGDFIDYEEIK